MPRIKLHMLRGVGILANVRISGWHLFAPGFPFSLDTKSSICVSNANCRAINCVYLSGVKEALERETFCQGAEKRGHWGL